MSAVPRETGVLGAEFRQRAAERLSGTDELLARAYPGDPGTRQPVHTVYVPADAFTADTVRQWGVRAAEAVARPGLRSLAEQVAPEGADPGLIDQVVRAVERKLADEPIEDLRLDFEDGFGDRGDEAEDAWAVRAARTAAEAVRAGTAPPFIGIRFKCFEAPTRTRGLRTLDLFLATLVREGGLREAGLSEDGLPAGFVLTLPKVSTPEQVQVMAEACGQLEAALALRPGRLRFEVQMETAPMILGPDGTCPIPAMLHRTGGRVEALHYGTYDYSDSLQIAARYQSLEHPAADHAKAVMQVAVAGTGVRLSDGSTNVLPVGDDHQRQAAWRLHARLVRRSLERGYYQGWDLHPAQLPTRFLATYFFYRQGFAAAARRLRNYVHGIESEILDEPATARALARFVHRGVLCGAVSPAELADAAGVAEQELFALAHPKAATPSTPGDN
ncbi:DUF6986 family protein [Arthrobacter sp. GCM10027362]|uniref:DUF6986 family protein n=1 Tax=Arthrobacter sp. GCM10027362 TaxID=3273379 RepID=UPI003643CBE6